mgnify:CR=1 FL=1
MIKSFFAEVGLFTFFNSYVKEQISKSVVVSEHDEGDEIQVKENQAVCCFIVLEGIVEK